MKKIYSAMVAATVVLAMSATSFGASDAGLRSRTVSRTVNSKEMKEFPSQLSVEKHQSQLKGMRKADGQPSIEGAWTFMLGDYYFDNSEGTIIPGYYSASLDDENNVTFTPVIVDGDKFQEFKGTYDPSTNKVSFPKMYLGIQYKYYIFQVPYRYNADTEELEDLDALVGTYVPDEGAIYFDGDEGLTWDGYTDSLGEGESEGSLWTFDFYYAIQFDASSSIEGDWTDIGLATFVDGWLVPALRIDQKKNSYSVLLQQSNDNKWVYRLVNPYFSGPVAGYNWYEGDGYIVFDISDPDHVLFLPCNAGFASPNIIANGMDDLYVYNYLGFVAASNPDMTVEDIVSLAGNNIPYTTYKDGVITLSYVNNPTTRQPLYDANFGTNHNPFGGSTWDGLNMEASITFPSWYDAEVGAIAVDEDAPAVYFDINGLKVNNPVKGQLVIKREGNKVTKEIVK